MLYCTKREEGVWLKELIKFSDVLKDEMDTSKVKLEIELGLLLKDFIDLITAIRVYEQTNDSERVANKLLFIEYTGIIDQALVYRIVIGVSKLFDSDSNARTVKKLIHAFSQDKEFQTPNILKIIDDINSLNETIVKEYNFKLLRDKFFAHLDKRMRFSSMRIGYQLFELENLLILLVNIFEKLKKLYNSCFSEKFYGKVTKYIEIPKIENLIDVKERAVEFVKSHKHLEKQLIVDSKGLNFVKKSGV